MKKFLLITLVMFLTFGSFAKNKFEKVNTVYTDIPVKIMFKRDSLFNVSINEQAGNYVKYEVLNDTVLKITHKGLWYDVKNEVPVVKIKTPKPLNVECSRYLKIH
jgi:hypothetical protein